MESSNTMTARTLEEIEALAAEATPGPWTTKGKSVKALGAPSERTAPNGWQGGICNCMGSGHGPRSRIDALAETNAALIAELPNLLAIAQEQRAELEKVKAQRKEESRIALGIIKHNEYDLERLRNDLATKCAEIERWRGLYYGCDGTDQAAPA